MMPVVSARLHTRRFWRRRCLDALGTSPDEELDFLASITDDNPKNYQIWCGMLFAILDVLDCPVAALALQRLSAACTAKSFCQFAKKNTEAVRACAQRTDTAARESLRRDLFGLMPSAFRACGGTALFAHAFMKCHHGFYDLSVREKNWCSRTRGAKVSLPE